MIGTLIKNARIINDGQIFHGDVLVKGERIERIDGEIADDNYDIVDVRGKWLIPGIIDDQVHFREPGLTHKADIASESAAAAAGGVTSFMEMPNTRPPAVTQELLEAKYKVASESSTVNYSFFMGASNENLEEVLRTDKSKVCGVKIFMGSSTGNMLVDDYTVLNKLFSRLDCLIATHCEDEETIRGNLRDYYNRYGDKLDASYHPLIRDTDACYRSSSMAVDLASKYNARLHVLHISTEKEISLFSSARPLKDKNITAEVCVHHLSFDADDYEKLGNRIKCNPAIKQASDRRALLEGLKNGNFDVIATDHAPHTIEEKSQSYMDAPSGLPLVQHSLAMMLQFCHRKELSPEFIVSKMCHAPADLFRIEDRGYIREGYFADLVVVDPADTFTVAQSNILYKCGWSPLEGRELKGRPVSTMANGTWVFRDGKLTGRKAAQRLRFST